MNGYALLLSGLAPLALATSLGACGARYDVGDGAAGAGGSASGATAGASGTTGGTRTTDSGGNGAASSGGSAGTGEPGATGGSGGSAGTSNPSATGGSSGGGPIDSLAANPTCGASQATNFDYGNLAAPDVVRARLMLLLDADQPALVPELPAETTAAWAADAATEKLDAAAMNDAPPAGLARFIRSWLAVGDAADGEQAVASGSDAFGRSGSSFASLVAPAGRRGLLEDAGLNRIHRTISNRGAFLLNLLFCLDVGPDGPTNNLPPPVDGLTPRQSIEAATNSSSCRACHSLIDPLGYSLEGFDPATGEPRTRYDDGQPIDASGSFSVPTDSGSGAELEFTSMDDLAPELADSCSVARCFVRAYGADATGALGLPPLSDAEVDFMLARYAGSGSSLWELVRAFVQTPTFLR